MQINCLHWSLMLPSQGHAVTVSLGLRLLHMLITRMVASRSWVNYAVLLNISPRPLYHCCDRKHFLLIHPTYKWERSDVHINSRTRMPCIATTCKGTNVSIPCFPEPFGWRKQSLKGRLSLPRRRTSSYYLLLTWTSEHRSRSDRDGGKKLAL